MTTRRRFRIRAGTALGGLIAGFAASACSLEQTLPPPDCEDGGSALIVAQSVPTAAQIPCFTDLPTGWSVATVLVNEHHTVITLDSDRAGAGAAVLRLEGFCDVSGAESAPSDQPAADRYDAIAQVQPSFQAERFYLFPGGCVIWTFAFDDDASATESVAIGDTLVLYSREDLQRGVSESFVDEKI